MSSAWTDRESFSSSRTESFCDCQTGRAVETKNGIGTPRLLPPVSCDERERERESGHVRECVCVCECERVDVWVCVKGQVSESVCATG